MRTDYEQTYHAVEDTHWWFTGRRDMIMRIVAPMQKNIGILEIGCSGGALLRELRLAGFTDVHGIDVSKKAVEVCKARGLERVSVMDGAHTSFPEESFDVVIASDVLEHINDDAAALREWRRVLKRGGTLLLFVPAHMFLWSAHDEANQHVRRYARKDLLAKVAANGFFLRQSSYWNALLFVPIWVARLVVKMLPVSWGGGGHQLGQTVGMLNVLFSKLLLIENACITRGFSLPFGVSMFVHARKQ